MNEFTTLDWVCIILILVSFWLIFNGLQGKAQARAIEARLKADETPRKLYIFDIDGTISLTEHRNHFLQGQEEKKWDDFYEACDKDKPFTAVIEILNNLYDNGNEIWFFTGRSASVREKTIEWFVQHTEIPRSYLQDHILNMRDVGDHTPDNELKELWYDGMLEEDKARLVCVFEDRKRVVDMWRAKGVPVMHVAPGEF